MERDGNRWLFYCGSADKKHRRGNGTSALNIIIWAGRADIWNDLLKSPDRT